jgi:hypothetical protein
VNEARASAGVSLLRPSRRAFIKTGLLGGAALWLASAAAPAPAKEPPREGGPAFEFLTPDDRLIVGAIAPVMLAGALPEDAAAHGDAVDDVVLGVDIGISGLPPATQAELRELLDLLNLAPARVLLAGLWSSWPEASAAEIADFLEGWRTSWFALLRSAYLGLHELILAAWYGNPQSWPRVGYDGPPELG